RGDGDDEECGGPYKDHPKKEHICGRPLGLSFNIASGQLYVADAYMGLVVIEPNGGTARKITSHAIEGEPLAFTNSLDIDQRTGAVYFTSSSSKYQRRNYVSLILSGDKSGKLIKYEPKSEQVTILLNNLTFANGVALSKDGNYILIAETTNCRILRYWLQTSKAGTLEVFANLPGSSGLAIRLSEEGDVLEIVEDHRSGIRRSISDIEEKDGVLWVGSVDAPFALMYNTLVAQE
ncbi:strictosidine synthase 1-like protein, partial [Trifolium pratense]